MRSGEKVTNCPRLRLSAALVAIVVLALQTIFAPVAHAAGKAQVSDWCSGAGTGPDPASGDEESCCLHGCSVVARSDAGVSIGSLPPPPRLISLPSRDLASTFLFPPAAAADPRAPPRSFGRS